MPHETETPRSLLAHCPDPRCKGGAQRAVEGIEVLLEWSYKERGGGQGPPGVETSVTHFKFANPDRDAKCNVCGRNRELSSQERPRYDPLSGHSPDGLLHVERWSPGGRTAEVEAMLEKLAGKLDG